MARIDFKGQELLEAQITEIVDGLIEELGLGWIDITCRFNTMAADDGTIAETSVLPHYREAVISWSLKHCVDKTQDYLVATAIHELVHVAVADMEQLVREGRKDSDLREKQCERAVENVARMILAARKKRDG